MAGNILFLVALASIWVMLLYHMFLMLGGYLHSERMERLKQKPRPKRADDEWPFVSVLIPAHNEEIVIRYTLDAMLRLDYPHNRIEIIVIDDNSGDSTGEIVDSYCARDPRVRCLHLKPPHAAKGKSNALNQALKIARGEYIVVYDADNTPNSAAVKHLVEAALDDPKAGAIVGKFRVVNARKNLLTRFINIETISFQWMAQAGRWHWFGISTIPGTNFLIRKSLIEEMGGWDDKALTEDTELSIRLYDNGYHIRFYPLAVTWEQEPETWRVWLKQRTRWARGNQYVIMKNLPRIFGRWKGRIVFDLVYFFFTYFIFLGAVILSHLLMLLNILGAINITLPGPFLLVWLLAYILYIVEIMVTLAIEKTELTFRNFLILSLMYISYSQLWLYLIFRSGWIELRARIRHDELKWDKTQRFQTKAAKDYSK